MTKKKLQSVDAVQEWLNDHDYIADRSLATSIYLMLKMEKPLFLEGRAGRRQDGSG